MVTKNTYAKSLRLFRKVHRTTGALLFIFFFIISITGILLGWKNNSNGYIIPKTQQGSTNNLAEWLPINQLHTIATNSLADSVGSTISLKLDRIDIRKQHGIVKFVFEDHLWEVQLDGKTGAVLQIAKRQSDLIESIHDGSIIDRALGLENGQLKVVYTTITGLALFLFTFTGFWLWYGPKRMKKLKRQSSKQ